MSSNTTPQAAVAETEIQQATGGALMPDATQNLEKLLLVMLMVPTGDPRPGPEHPAPRPNEPPNPYGCNMGMPSVLWGLSGIGKSAIIKQAAKKLGLPIEIIYPGTHMPEDFSALPVVIQDQLMSACMLTQVTELNKAGGGLLFLDEVSCAPPAVQGAMLSMVLERKVGAVRFHPGIRLLMAANPPEYSAGGWGLEAPFANRAAHLYVRKPPTEKLVEWILSEGSHRVQPLDDQLALLQQNWGEAWSRVRGLWVGFVNTHSSIRHIQPKPDHVQAGYCWPSDRTWEFAFRCLATCRAMKMEPILEPLLIEACVGEGAAIEFINWAKNTDLPDPRDVLDGKWTMPKQLDRVHAIFASVTALVIDQPQGHERFVMASKAWNRLLDLANAGQTDLTATHASALIQDGLGPLQPGIPDFLKKAAEAPMLKTGRVAGLTKQYR